MHTQMAIGVLSTMFGGTYMMMGGSKKRPELAPPINASSKDEENFIQYVAKPYHTTPLRPVC